MPPPVAPSMPASVRLLAIHKASVCGGNVAWPGVFHNILGNGAIKGVAENKISWRELFFKWMIEAPLLKYFCQPLQNLAVLHSPHEPSNDLVFSSKDLKLPDLCMTSVSHIRLYSIQVLNELPMYICICRPRLSAHSTHYRGFTLCWAKAWSSITSPVITVILQCLSVPDNSLIIYLCSSKSNEVKHAAMTVFKVEKLILIIL